MHKLRVRLLIVNSAFAANYQYLSFKFDLTEADWCTSSDHLLGKDKKKIALLPPQPVLCGVLKELCAIRDNTSLCDIADNNDIGVLINDVLTESMMSAIWCACYVSFSFFCVCTVYMIYVYNYLYLLCYMCNVVLSEPSDMYE